MERISLKDNPTGQGLLLVTLALLGLGAVMVNSATASPTQPGAWYSRVDIRQTMFAAAAVLALLIFWRIDYRRLAAGKAPWLAAGLLAAALVSGVLVFVPGIGHQVGNKWRWIRLGPEQYSMGFQPSELIKISLLVFLACWLSRPGVQVRSFTRTFLPAAGLVGLCIALVVKNDFGTAGLIGLTAGATLFIAGVPWYYLAALLPPAAGGFYKFVYLDPDRWARIAVMADPMSVSNPTAYQTRQSLLAILSGGLFGKGLGNGTVKLGYLPEDSTDFIFAVICEELGLVGAAMVLGLLAIWIWLARRAALRAPDQLGRLLAASLGFAIAAQTLIHVAVDTVAVPPTGMSMPFVSAGGTSTVLLAGAVGLIVSVTARSLRQTRQAGAGLVAESRA